MIIAPKPHPKLRWVPLALSGLALAAGVAGAAPTVGPAWTARYDNPQRMITAADLLVDSAGNSYAVMLDDWTGALQVAKHGKSGQRLWAEEINPGGMLTSISAALDKDGNVIVSSGYEDIDSTVQAVWVVKFTSSGDWAWDVMYDGPLDSYVFPGGIAVDSTGDVYLSGEGDSDVENSSSALVARLDGDDGGLIWEASSTGEPDTFRHGAALVVDNAGGVYVTGGTEDDPETQDFFTFKLDAANGAALWNATFDGPNSGHDVAVDIALSGTGVVVTGVSDGPDGPDYQTLKYNRSDGAQVWSARYDGPAAGTESRDEPTDLAVDSAGNVYVTGNSAGTGSSALDFATVKYNGTTGTQAWAARYDAPGEEDDLEPLVDSARAVAVDANGNVYVTGDAVGTDFQVDLGTIKYNSAGQQQWVHLFNYRGFDDRSAALGLDGAGNVYVSGTYTIDENEDHGVVVLKFLSSGRGTPAPRIPRPTFTFSESAKDKLVCFREEGETFCEEATSSTFKITSTATMQDVDITAFDEETPFALSIGNLELDRVLGDDPRYTPGKTRATFTETIFDENDRERKALTITLSWPRGKLKVGVTSTPYFEEGVLAGDYLDEETGSITDTASAAVTLGDFTQEFDVAVKGRVTTRPTRDEEFSISTVTLTGKGTGL